MKTTLTRKNLAALIRSIRADIEPDFRAYDDSDAPSILLTVGMDKSGDWSFQTGDTSFTGGAYGYPFWGQSAIYRDTNSFHAADEILGEIEDAASM